MALNKLFPWILSAFLLVACTPGLTSSSDVPDDDGSDAPDQGELHGPCGPEIDQDEDSIPTDVEGTADSDGDTIPDYLDPDSDNDTIPDAVEAGDDDCSTPPVDSDGDGRPDYLDTDSDDNGIDDSTEGAEDSDDDGTPDYSDPDNDGDGIPDSDEIGDDPDHPSDQDDDGVPDYVDTDSDGDGIPDLVEGAGDADGDGTPNYLDDDSDGDGIPDAEEYRGCSPEASGPADTDGDGMPDFLDRDSDNDGLSDAREKEIGTNRCSSDTDGDGFDDFVEWLHPDADPLDPAKGIPEDDFYVILPYEGLIEERDLTFGTAIRSADVFLLVDTTGSMSQEIDRIVAALSSTIIPETRSRIADTQFGVGWLADFATGEYGSGGDRPFFLMTEMTPDTAAAQTAVSLLPRNGGDDLPESQVEALYQTATGEGLGDWVYAYPCAEGLGAPCFRGGSLPVILLFTDAPMHNGPPGTVADPYTGIDPAPHKWDQAVSVLNRIRAKVIGIDSEDPEGDPEMVDAAFQDLLATAVATGTEDFKGNPLVFRIAPDGTGLDTTVVTAIEILSTEVPFNIDTYTLDEPDGYDDPGWREVDATCFIKNRIPQPGWTPPPGYSYTDAVDFYDASTFYGVLPGTRVTFRIQFVNDTCFPADVVPRVFLARIVVRGGGVTDLDEREVIILVPPAEL